MILAGSFAPSVAPLLRTPAKSPGVTGRRSVTCFGSSPSAGKCAYRAAGLRHEAPFPLSTPLAPCNRPAYLQVAAKSAAGAVEGTVAQEAYGIRRIAWVSFWSQLSLAIISAVVVFFTMSSSSNGVVPPLPVLFTLFGVATSFISTGLAWQMVRTAKKVIVENATIKKDSIASTLLTNQTLNLFGIGSALIGLQATVGTLVAKTLTSSTSNPYAAAGQAARTTTPTALDAFSVQASTNTILAHFVSIIFANWLQKILLKPSKSGIAAAKPDEPDYTQRKGPSGTQYG